MLAFFRPCNFPQSYKIIELHGMTVFCYIFDPLGPPTVTASWGSLFLHMSSVQTFQNLAKQYKAKTMFAMTVGQAEWIIDDTGLVFLFCELVIVKQKPKKEFEGQF